MTSNKSSRTRKFIKKLNCAPISKNLKKTMKLKNKSCYQDKGLQKMSEFWNMRHPDDKINSKEPRIIWNFFKNKFSKVCNNEKCWLRQKFIENNNKELLKYFSPDAPSIWSDNPYTWLNSNDLKNIMVQYEEAYKNFEFIGPSPIDFDKIIMDNECVWDELCNFSLTSKIKKNINKIGIIFNTDPHDKKGQHWIAVFIDIKNSFIMYFDSNGYKIPNEINIFIERVIKQGKDIDINFKYYDNYKFQHQKNDGQCGIYTLYFIIELLLENKSPEYFKTTRITDETMKDHRLIYYN